MQPVSPVLGEEFVANEILYAKDQPEYIPLPVIRSSQGLVLSRWKLTDSEREAVAAGADIYLSVLTFFKPLQPVRLEVCECAVDVAALAERVGLLGRVEDGDPA